LRKNLFLILIFHKKERKKKRENEKKKNEKEPFRLNFYLLLTFQHDELKVRMEITPELLFKKFFIQKKE